ncbi:hypothetical protein BRADI_3g16805v3 [Brachypodium distachyon]|uniref:Protein kinase domain-containing protein n=1 Tax=Brachypodium distachyon TaxID=15368 RepID=A0A0Q3JAQ4_BRADI|nr:hypothetical protein BRADI_3g16805v3 [Brachypodium distachyon]
MAHHVDSRELPYWHRLVRSSKVDPCKIKTCDLGLETSVKQYIGRVDVVVHDGAIVPMMQVVVISSVVVQVLTMSPWSFSPFGCSWLSKRSNCHVLCYNEQYMINNLGDDNAMSNIVDGGTWRSVLYRIPLQDTLTPVVVKKLQNKSGPVDATPDCRRQSELNLLGRIGHGNIISLADWIRRDNFILIVYDHKENGSLHQWLHHDPAERVLDWPTRRAIAVAVAGGLCYLHHGRKSPIVHDNINSTNILLDIGLKPKIAGFDFAQVNLAGPDQPVPIWELTTGNMFGYTAPEYVTMVTTAKVDVYSLGAAGARHRSGGQRSCCGWPLGNLGRETLQPPDGEHR